MNIKLTLLSLLLVITSGCSEQDANRTSLAEAAKSIEEFILGGAIVTAEKIDGEIAFSAVGNLEPSGVAPERVIFEIGSITKVFTGLLLAQAVTEGKVTLDSTLREILTTLEFEDPAVGAITLRQLATHKSGLPRKPEDLDIDSDPDDPYAHYDRSRLMAYIERMELDGKAPFQSSYSNLGVGLLGDVLSQVYGQRWDRLVAEKITIPLGMKDTVTFLDDEQKQRYAPAYHGDETGSQWHLSGKSALAGCGVLKSTASDLIIFAEALQTPEKTPFSRAIELLLSPQTEDESIGLAIGINVDAGEKMCGHGGATGGYNSMLLASQESDLIQVVLINNRVVDGTIVINEAYNESTRFSKSEKRMSRNELVEYRGIYVVDSNNHLNGKQFSIELRDDGLWESFDQQQFLKLYADQANDRFFLREVNAECQFVRENGEVRELIWFQSEMETRAIKLDRQR